MRKRSNKHIKSRLDNMKFAEFWLFIGEQIGNAHLHLNSKAKTLDDFFHRIAYSDPLLKTAITQSYKKSGASSLKSPFNPEKTLDVLGLIAFDLRGTHTADLCAIELLEEIAFHITHKSAVCGARRKQKP